MTISLLLTGLVNSLYCMVSEEIYVKYMHCDYLIKVLRNMDDRLPAKTAKIRSLKIFYKYTIVIQ